MTTVPVLSYAQWRRGTPAEQAQFQGDLLRGLQRYGFIILRDHDVPTALLDRAYELVRALFALHGRGLLQRLAGDLWSRLTPG